MTLWGVARTLGCHGGILTIHSGHPAVPGGTRRLLE
jgi:hypothetical protein